MGRLCGGAHEISGIKAQLFLHGLVVVGGGVGVVGWVVAGWVVGVVGWVDGGDGDWVGWWWGVLVRDVVGHG